MTVDVPGVRRRFQRASKSAVAKRAFDLAVASTVLAVSSPVSAVCAVAIKLTSAGPIIYKAPRAGVDGEEFAMYKFRTMVAGLDSVDRRVTAADDDRITAVGAVLRKTKLDELPQLVNVVKGEMSIVGPRPEDIDIVKNHYTPDQWRTLSIRPGIASYAEVVWYPDLTYHDPPPGGVAVQEWYIERHLPAELEQSLRYVDERSLRLDISILVRIVAKVVWYSFTDPPKRPLDEPATPIEPASPIETEKRGNET